MNSRTRRRTASARGSTRVRICFAPAAGAVFETSPPGLIDSHRGREPVHARLKRARSRHGVGQPVQRTSPTTRFAEAGPRSRRVVNDLNGRAPQVLYNNVPFGGKKQSGIGMHLPSISCP